MADTKHPRRFLRFSLRAMLLLVLLVAVPLGWFRWQVERARQQRLAIMALEELGCDIQDTYGSDMFNTPSIADRLAKRWFNEELTPNVDCVNAARHMKDANLALLQRLSGLKELLLCYSQVTDAGLAQLDRLTTLTYLDLEATSVGDAGLAHVRKLSQLKILILDGTQVTDAGLVHLHGLGQLKILYIGDTNVTDAGIAALKKSLPRLYVDRTDLSY